MTIRSFICALALAAFGIAGIANAEMLDNSELSLDPSEQTEQIESMIEVVFEPLEKKVPGVVKKMIKIADCESYGGRDGLIMHVDQSGQLIRNTETKRARGVFLIVPNPHDKMAASMGLDVVQVSDNIKYSRFLVEDRIRMGMIHLKTGSVHNNSTGDRQAACFLLFGEISKCNDS